MSGSDSAQSIQEWRWRAYRDHLEDLGYDLDGGSGATGEAAVTPAASAAIRALAEDPNPARRRPGDPA